MLPITRRNDGSLINDRVERIELLFFSTYLIPNQRSVWTSNYNGIRPYFKLLQRHEKFMLGTVPSKRTSISFGHPV